VEDRHLGADVTHSSFESRPNRKWTSSTGGLPPPRLR
jgi:hypothetical protein